CCRACGGPSRAFGHRFAACGGRTHGIAAPVGAQVVAHATTAAFALGPASTDERARSRDRRASENDTREPPIDTCRAEKDTRPAREPHADGRRGRVAEP